MITLRTKRLIIREFTKNDITEIFEIFGDDEVNKFLPWYPLKSIEEAKTFYATELKNTQKLLYSYAICLNDNHPIGYINVGMNDSYDLGYGLRKEFWHNGIVTEAGKTVIEQLKKDSIPYITATHDINNPQSGYVMKRLGMKYQYSYEEQWQPKNILVVFRMYQLNLDGNSSKVYKKYWDSANIRFIENSV